MCCFQFNMLTVFFFYSTWFLTALTSACEKVVISSNRFLWICLMSLPRRGGFCSEYLSSFPLSSVTAFSIPLLIACLVPKKTKKHVFSPPYN